MEVELAHTKLENESYQLNYGMLCCTIASPKEAMTLTPSAFHYKNNADKIPSNNSPPSFGHPIVDGILKLLQSLVSVALNNFSPEIT